MEELRQYSRGHLLNLLRATAAGEDSEGATVSTAAAPQRAASPACEGPLPRAAEAEAAEAAGLAAQERREQRPQQHELLQEPAARPQQETPVGTGAAALQQAAPKQAAPQQAAVQQHEPQQPELALPGGFYHHYFGVTPQLPDPTVTSYKAQLNLALASNGQPQRPSRRVGGKAAQPVCLLACPTQAEAAAARDLGALWREQRLRGGGSKPHRGHRPLFNFDESRCGCNHRRGGAACSSGGPSWSGSKGLGAACYWLRLQPLARCAATEQPQACASCDRCSTPGICEG